MYIYGNKRKHVGIASISNTFKTVSEIKNNFQYRIMKYREKSPKYSWITLALKYNLLFVGNVYCTVYYNMSYTIYSVMYNVHYTIVHYMIVHCTLYIVQCTVYNVHYMYMHSVHRSSCTLLIFNKQCFPCIHLMNISIIVA